MECPTRSALLALMICVIFLIEIVSKRVMLERGLPWRSADVCYKMWCADPRCIGLLNVSYNAGLDGLVMWQDNCRSCMIRIQYEIFDKSPNKDLNIYDIRDIMELPNFCNKNDTDINGASSWLLFVAAQATHNISYTEVETKSDKYDNTDVFYSTTTVPPFKTNLRPPTVKLGKKKPAVEDENGTDDYFESENISKDLPKLDLTLPFTIMFVVALILFGIAIAGYIYLPKLCRRVYFHSNRRDIPLS